ncbi:MAG: HAD-IIIA family hydrolase [Alphaproteobacteria bacterium]|nr:HAD-IIIA family hydrolase [Methylococcales bacterium]MCK5374830.1 HAD-IIIA family hydrolase [Alphaproteobacteria bacterium]
MARRFDLIIFDWDGTLVDSIDWIVYCLQKAAGEYGCNVPEKQAAKDIIGLSIQRAMETLFPGIDQKTQEQLIACYSKQFFSKQITEDDLFTGVSEMLVNLKQMGYFVAIATGKSRVGLDRAMKGTGLSDFFHVTRCADQTASKPQPAMLEEIIKEMAVCKERVVMVGDSVHDMQMAINAGIASIAVSCGAHSSEQLQQYNPLFNLQQTTELLDSL